ncbi:MAG: gamma-glutamyltranspeptidase / glutathione hydrolase [Sphingomonadales bacterium]|jgi:gamma-glutamyltranspeptidase/glutathione hydrolase|nr:gamma-glutamyltranspeptidase / glutathione hydrolase [Sphingomonadales bacterium]
MLRNLFLACALLLGACTTPATRTPPAAAVGAAGAVSAADPRAADAGARILREGGSAADAAFATMLALTVVEPQSSGIGGGGFLLYHDQATGHLSSYDGRETAPHAATPAYFLGPDGQPRQIGEAIPGGLSVGVPGNIRLMEMAHERHGRLPWARLFQPAIRLARDGFAITPRMHRLLSSPGSLARFSPWGRAQFYGEDGQPKPVGTMIRNPDFAALLERIAARGPEAFYTGQDAQALVRTVRGSERNPSAMTADDLATYQARERAPVCGSYRGYRICGMGPPSSGATTVLAILKQVERFDLRALGRDNPVAWHLIAESMRLAYADRDLYLGDPDFVAVPVAGLTDAAYLAARSLLISPDRTIAHVTAGTPAGGGRRAAAPVAHESGTSHFVVVDTAGNVASYTSTIESVYGSGLTVNGMFLNNELTDFSFAPELNGAPVANRVEGGKRPRSSMSPTIVYGPDGRVRLAVGAAGGSTIIAQVAKAIIAVIDWDLSAQEAIALPQIIGMGDRVTIERGTGLEAMMPALQALGQNVVIVDPGYKANAIERVHGRWVGAADPRSEGSWIAQ